MKKLCTIIATGFGLGYAPVASGTFGSMLGLAIAWLMTLLPLNGSALVIAQAALCVALAAVCVPICSVAEDALGGEKDNGKIVADEYLTFPICTIGLPWALPGNWWMLVMAFVVNRAMDIVKPYPAYKLQSLPRGLGVTIDDAIASCYALALNWSIVAFIGHC